MEAFACGFHDDDPRNVCRALTLGQTYHESPWHSSINAHSYKLRYHPTESAPGPSLLSGWQMSFSVSVRGGSHQPVGLAW